jgi:hypothetical protein
LNDLWLEENTFVNNLRQLMGDKLYNSEHKKIMARAQRGKAGESTVAKVREEID